MTKHAQDEGINWLVQKILNLECYFQVALWICPSAVRRQEQGESIDAVGAILFSK